MNTDVSTSAMREVDILSLTATQQNFQKVSFAAAVTSMSPVIIYARCEDMSPTSTYEI